MRTAIPREWSRRCFVAATCVALPLASRNGVIGDTGTYAWTMYAEPVTFQLLFHVELRSGAVAEVSGGILAARSPRDARKGLEATYHPTLRSQIHPVVNTFPTLPERVCRAMPEAAEVRAELLIWQERLHRKQESVARCPP